MPLTVAIVGRPNVGKSTLFNRLIGKRLALVDDEPGVTRDRREGDAKLRDLHFTIIDTAGLEESGPKTLSGRMRAQTETAIADADIVLFVIDARMGPTYADQGFAELVRRSDKPVILLANKAEGKAGREGALEAYSLGLGEPVSISAEHGEGMPELYDALRVHAPRDEEEADDENDDRDIGRDDEEAEALPPIIRVAVIGRPNAGKSTMINRLLGEERLLTGPEAGITRDSIAVEVEHDGITFRIFDTAGIRRRARVEEKLEKLSVADALNAVRFAEVVVLMMDAERPFEDQDLKLADLIEREGRALVLAMNKWDLVEHKPGSIGKLREEADHWLPQVKGVPIVAISGLRNEGLDRLLKAVVDIRNVWNKRVPTTPLNRWLEETLASHPPPAVSGRRLKFNYMTQAKARPPSFVLFCTRADAVPEGYKRYLVNGLREAFDLIGTPIRITLREKKNPYADRERRHR